MKKLSLLTLLSSTILFSNIAFGETSKTTTTEPITKEDSASKTEDRVLAKYGKQVIKLSEIEEKLKGQLPSGKSFTDLGMDEQTAIIKRMVIIKLIDDEAKKSDVVNTESYKKKLADAIDNQKKLIDELPDMVLRAEFAETKNKEFEPKEADIQKEYDKMLEKVQKDDEVQVSHILVNTEKEANEILAEIKAGKSFEELAKSKSIDPSTKDKGGELGYFGRDSHMDKAFEDASFALKKDEVSPVVKSSFGFHIIKLIDKRKKSLPPFEQLKNNIKHELQNKAFQNYIEGLEKQAGLEIFPEQKKK